MVDSPSGITVTWPPRMKTTWGRRTAEAGDRVGEAFEGLFEQRGFVDHGADRRFTLALVGGEFERSQRLPRCSWSISKALGRVTATDLMLASPGWC